MQTPLFRQGFDTHAFGEEGARIFIPAGGFILKRFGDGIVALPSSDS